MFSATTPKDGGRAGAGYAADEEALGPGRDLGEPFVNRCHSHPAGGAFRYFYGFLLLSFPQPRLWWFSGIISFVASFLAALSDR